MRVSLLPGFDFNLLFNKFRLEQWLYILFVVALAFPIIFHLGTPHPAFQLSDLLFVISAGAWGLSVITRRSTLRWSWLYAFLAAYGLAVILSTIASIDPTQSSVKLVGKFYLIGISFLTYNVIMSIGSLKGVFQAWVGSTSIVVIISLLGIVLFYAGLTDPAKNLVLHPIYGSLPPGPYPRIEGFFLHPAMLSNYLSVSWMFALALTSIMQIRLRTVCLFALGVFIVSAFTLTPGIGGIFLATGFFLQERLISIQRAFLGHIVLATAILLAASFLFAASVTVFSYDPEGSNIPLLSGEVSPSHRANAWRTAFVTFLDYPLVGRGIGMPAARSEFTDPSGRHQLLTDAHSTYISVLAETGVFGFVAFFSMVGYLTLRLVRWQSESKFGQTIKLCLLLALIDAFFYQGLTGSYEDTRHLWVLFGITAAVTGQSSINYGGNTETGPYP